MKTDYCLQELEDSLSENSEPFPLAYIHINLATVGVCWLLVGVSRLRIIHLIEEIVFQWIVSFRVGTGTRSSLGF